MSGINKVIIVGRLGADPELKAVGQGSTVCRITVATSENWVDKNNQKQSKTEWYRVVIWGKLAEICGKYLSKGSQVYLEGKLQTRSWEKEGGHKMYTTEIIVNKVEFLSRNGAAKSHSADPAETQPDMEGSQGGDFDANDFGPFEPDSNNDGGDIPF